MHIFITDLFLAELFGMVEFHSYVCELLTQESRAVARKPRDAACFHCFVYSSSRVWRDSSIVIHAHCIKADLNVKP